MAHTHTHTNIDSDANPSKHRKRQEEAERHKASMCDLAIEGFHTHIKNSDNVCPTELMMSRVGMVVRMANLPGGHSAGRHPNTVCANRASKAILETQLRLAS